MDGMQPNQPDYEFIMNPQQQSSGPNFAGPQKLLMIVGLFAVVIVVVIVLFSVLFSGGASNRNALVEARADQIEMARVIELGIDDVVDVNLKRQFQTLLTSSTSDAQEIAALLATREVKVEPFELKASFNASVEDSLDEAKQKNDFDPAYEDAVAAAAGQYLQSLQRASSSAASTRESNLLTVAINNVQTVAQQPTAN